MEKLNIFILSLLVGLCCGQQVIPFTYVTPSNSSLTLTVTAPTTLYLGFNSLNYSLGADSFGNSVTSLSNASIAFFVYSGSSQFLSSVSGIDFTNTTYKVDVTGGYLLDNVNSNITAQIGFTENFASSPSQTFSRTFTQQLTLISNTTTTSTLTTSTGSSTTTSSASSFKINSSYIFAALFLIVLGLVL